jgi:hypothetical protein
MQKAGVEPTPALIETTANPKRCGFGLSIQKFGSLGPSPDRPKPASGPDLLDFLDAGDEFRRLFSMLFRDSGGGESQNNYDFLGCEYVHAPFNCGAVDLARPALAEMWHAIVSVCGTFVRRLDVLDRLTQFVGEVLYGGIEGVLIGYIKDHLQTVVRARHSHNLPIWFCFPALWQFELDAGSLVAEEPVLLGSWCA